MIERDRLRRDRLLKDRVQVAPMDIQIWTAEACLTLRIKDNLIHCLPGVPGAADIAIRLYAGFDERTFNTEPPERFHDVGAENDSRPYAGESWSLFVDRDGKAGALQETGDAQSSEAGTDDRNPIIAFHSC